MEFTMTISGIVSRWRAGSAPSVGIIGLGSFGQFARERFEASRRFRVLGFDPNPRKHSNCTFIEAARTDIIILAVPIPAYEQTIIDALRAGSNGLIVDIATVKLHTTALLRRHANHRSFLATHPLFGPQSFAENGNSLTGLQVVFADRHGIDDNEYAIVRSFLESAGLVIVDMSPDEHDRTIVGEEQLLTQFVGRIVKKAGFARNTKNAHTLSARHFYLAMEIVAEDDELFRLVCQYNPYWKDIADRFEAAERDVRRELNGIRAVVA